MKGKILLYIAWGIALIGTLGSLYFSEIMGFAPCVLCWYQRIALYPLVLLLPIGILRQDKNVFYYAFPLTLFGFFVSFYQVLLQYNVISEKLAPCTLGVSCTTKYINWFGFVTIPLLSFIAFLCILVLLVLGKKKYDH